ncbi:PriCT-2 domain-containing protein, partial [Escherichia coli]
MSLAHEKYAWTEQDAAEALTFIDPDCDHETWTRLAFAVKAEFGDAGFDVWNDWSKQGQKYDSKEARQKWKSAKRHGGVTIGTLIDLSMQNGWKPGTRKELSIDEIQARAAKREAEAKAEAERKRHDQAAAAARALEIWEASEPLEGNEHPYLQRKGVLSFGLNVGRWKGYENALLVPIRNADGALTSLQAIFPNTNTDLGRDRDYLKDGQKHGCFHLIGGKPVGEKPVIVVCEGYATGASIHQATGHYVAVAFDRSNLKAVAQA